MSPLRGGTSNDASELVPKFGFVLELRLAFSPHNLSIESADSRSTQGPQSVLGGLQCVVITDIVYYLSRTGLSRPQP